MGVTPKRQLEASGKSKGWSRSSCVAHLFPFPNHIWQHEDRLLKLPELMSPEHVVVWYFQPMAVRSFDSYKWVLRVCLFIVFTINLNQSLNEKTPDELITESNLCLCDNWSALGSMTAACSALRSLSLIEAPVCPTGTLLPGNSNWQRGNHTRKDRGSKV